MKGRTSATVLLAVAVCALAVGGERNPLTALVTEPIDRARINLNPWGPHLGFETVIAGEDPRLRGLLTVIRGAEPAQGHKCANRAAIRFRMVGGEVIAIGLLPSHSEGFYEFRLYEGDRLQDVYRVRRAALFGALAKLGVPVDDPAFRS